MYFVFIGILLGILVGSFLKINIPPEYARYTAVAILGVIDSIFGALRSETEYKYDSVIFVTGLLFNMALAIFITYVGDKLNVELYLAVVIAFIIRIFLNIGIIRTISIEKLRALRAKRKSQETKKNR
ncbi:DUF1290 domain-containing protein [Candidatus Berkelbacteria bacterium CG_4_9_14_0_2_um_filter_42_30]|uniref:Small basic protein n=5 Tax=Candidatus Berkelbacteria TaxID=1618330 RepID=A0A2H0PYX7_9BACT|nr:MAG: hypothetical protein AUJ40_02500 [Candidatus Berkelbacteria bacterium CG1_02_42_45]PIR27272.1 MAG: small basic protein [Candidatus Berkelbacteria bacterium CG11_big_fil_rev_8_21_14_0_20_42_15]PIZ27529.1 MAG: DUF1290 domain-containing protein [Candidatus Berkelbacteria bacterium CG_4_10_14_0_8_um_filter_42_34]PJC65758.1 MAG: DUF1290 domain-containing protein [Candidatus Berkelbacteria bacterium CG_4_9_14_0_2_um_filter_42_30]